MNNSTLNFTTLEANTNHLSLLDSGEISLSCISILFGFPIHSYVLWLIVRGAESGVASEFFILNLSVCEIGNSLNALFNLLIDFFSQFTLIAYFLQGFAVTGRPLFQCLMCVERYLAVVHPVTFLKYKPLRYRVICCAVAWIITLGSCLFCMFTFESGLLSYIWFFSTQFFLFIFIQLFCLVAVLRALKQSEPGERKRKKEENHMKRRAFYIILITTINITVLYVPFSVTGFFVIVTQQYTFDGWFPASVCYALAGFVQPVLYLQRAGKLSCPTLGQILK
ncbi:C-C chemokine receptor type 8-like [Danio aesculapii]|uniref:C-C chemokine receptor type 8-like n=1 Tax=Danio aesculapii TaxID=1142201 RepID=UPI0024C09625|nr:C-C chemokine receptor type 8-like [Danio aesculapii]